MLIRRRFLLGLLSALFCGTFATADETVLFEKVSAYNTILVTENGAGLRTLWFEKHGARQSVVKPGDPDHLELPYARAMPLGLTFVESPKRALIVGLGGGTIPNFLHRHFPQLAIDIVDIDPDVVDVAKCFFGFREDARMRVYVDDGRRFIEKRDNHYDVIFLDAYGSDNIPYHLATREFLRSVRRALTPRGVVVANVWSSSSNPLYHSMVWTYRDVFDELFVLDVQGSGNKIVIGLPGKAPIGHNDLIRRAQEVSQRNKLPFDLGDLFRYGSTHAEEDVPPAPILTDKDPMPES